MPSDPQQAILAAFTQAAGSSAVGASPAGISSSLLPAGDDGITDALAQATQVINTQTQATSDNTDALGQVTQTRASGGTTGEVSSAVNTAGQFLGGGLSLMPLVSLFSGLFGGGQSDEPAALTPYSLPQSLNLESTTNYQNVSWGENGLPRAAGSSTASAPSQITVQVQAMDSQSFLDHSDEIAQAVRQAMLNMNPLNDVVSNL